jgi:hypothetical protein
MQFALHCSYYIKYHAKIQVFAFFYYRCYSCY